MREYNEDDCQSALSLRTWLENIRTQLVKEGKVIPRPTGGEGNPTEAVSEQERIINELKAQLTRGMPSVPEDRTSEQHAVWILAEILAWHRRENKAPWWEYFRLRELSDEELLDERGGLAGLRLLERVGGTARSPSIDIPFPFRSRIFVAVRVCL